MLVKTKYLGATNTKPSRIKAVASNRSFVQICFPYVDACPFRAALAELLEKMNLEGVSLTDKEKDAFLWRKAYFDNEVIFFSPE